MKEVIVRLTSDHIKVKGGEYVRDYPHGEWKRRIVDSGFNADWVCSECGYRVKTDFIDYNFCPNCGATMKGAGDE